MRNKVRDEYTRANSRRADGYPEFRNWLGNGRLHLLARHDRSIRERFGPAAFTWLSSGRQKAWVWVFDLTAESRLYVCTGTRGTSFEFTGPYLHELITAKINEVINAVPVLRQPDHGDDGGR